MAVSLSQLRTAASRSATVPVLRNLSEAKAYGVRTVFLCHSHLDKELAKGLVTLLAESGWTVYIDWADNTMPESPNRITAEKIKERITSSAFFLFLATPNSTKSRWCPWEIGFSDGKKGVDSVFIVPTVDGSTTYGNEYLQLYRQIDITQFGTATFRRPGDVGTSTPLKGL
jgi:hypothetical protein